MIPVIAHPLGEVHLHGKDTDVFGTRSSLDILVVARRAVERDSHGDAAGMSEGGYNG